MSSRRRVNPRVALKQVRGSGTLTVGADRYADIEYRIWIDESELGEEVAGLLTGDEHALRNAFVANSVVLLLEDGAAIEVRVTSIAPGQGRAGIDVVGPFPVLTGRPTAPLH